VSARRTCYVCGKDRDDVPPCGAWRDGQRAECPLTTDSDSSRANTQHVLKAEAQRGAPDATDRARPFSFLQPPSPATRAMLQRVCRQALARRFA
jgi:hypothetical protein